MDPTKLEFEGTISTTLSGMKFRVKLDNGHTVLAHLSGKFRNRWQWLVVGDRVKVEISPYEKEIGRITYRF